ncbi:MAG: pilus assembly protein PilM [Gemmatimonadota bacterium]|nr:MAG: pilus assembly protein PilM [Gemmatimonadota bacterium]
MFKFSRGSNRIVGLDIGSSSVKVVEFDHSNGTPRLVKFGRCGLLPEAIVDGEIMDRDVVVDTIAELMELNGITSREVVTGVSGRAVIVKKIQMDQMSVDEARDAIQWEAEQHVPFDIDDVSLDFQILNRESDPEKMDVLLVAAKKEMLESRADLIRAAGLTATVIDVDSFAVQNAFERNYEHPENSVTLLLNVGCFTSNVNIVKDGVPYFTRDLSFAGNAILEAIQKDLGVDYDEANNILENPGEDRRDDLESIVGLVGEELAVGIEKSLSYLRASGEADHIDRICLSGGAAYAPGLREAIEKRQGSPVEIANPFRNLEWDEGTFGEEDPAILGPHYMVATGLALRKGGE